VIAIIGILVSIAIPQFAAYRRRGYDAQVKADLKNAAVAQETYFTDTGTYTASVADLTPKGFRQTGGVTVVPDFTVGQRTFVISGTAVGCSAGTGSWSYVSEGGGVVAGTPCI
jgi:Tfp pilus assembly protein PilE